MDNNKKAIVVLDDFFGDDKLTYDMSAREAWDCIKGLLKEQEDLGTELTNAVELIHKKNERIKKLLKEQKLPTELKQKMWNALYAEEDEYEKKFVGKEEHLNWFIVYRPWLQKGFDIAINAIADWEGR